MISQRLRRLLRWLLLLASVLFSITAVSFIRDRVDYKLEATYGRRLRSLEALDAQLNVQVLAVRSNMLVRYDELVQRVRAIKQLQSELQEVPAFLGRVAVNDMRTQLGEHIALATSKERDVEQFKSYNAALRNSLHFFPTAAGLWGLDRRNAEPKISKVVEASVSTLLALDIMPAHDALVEFDKSLQELRSIRPSIQSAAESAQLELLTQHAQIILSLKPSVDGLIRKVVTSPVSESAARLSTTYARYYQAKLDSMNTQQNVLFALTIVIVALGLLEVIFKMQMHSAEMARASRELSAANTALAKERARERELNVLKSQFVSMTSHEFRTPLAGIISSSELLEKYANRWDADRIVSHLSRIKFAAQDMGHMLEEMLVIGRADAGMLKPVPTRLDLDEYCKRLLSTVSRNFKRHKPAQYRYEGDPGVMLDERLLTHVMSNLVENAFKYSSDDGCVTLTVQRIGSMCHIEVGDDGIGIPATDLEAIFESFHRASNVGRIAGTGLGLAVVKRAIDVQNGNISVSSELQRGTVFTVLLPTTTHDSDSSEICGP